MLSNLSPMIPFQTHPNNKAKLVHLILLQLFRMTFTQILIIFQDSVQALSHL